MTRTIVAVVIGFAVGAGLVVFVAAGDPDWKLDKSVRCDIVVMGVASAVLGVMVDVLLQLREMEKENGNAE